MLTKCANPECSSQFRYFHIGKVFVIESSEQEHKVRYYWLCERCCRKVSVEHATENGIIFRTVMSKPARAEGKGLFRVA